MDGFVEALFKYRPIVFERGTFALAAPWPMLIIVAVGALGIGLAWAYSRARGKSTPRDRILLTGVRVAVLGLAGFALLRPTLLVSTAVPQKNAIAILIDDSRSMRIADEDGRTRAEVAQRLFGTRDSSLARALGERFQLRYYRFSSSAEPMPDGSGLTFAGGRTHLRTALDRARQDLSTVPLAGLVIITDGADNSASALAEPLLALKAQGRVAIQQRVKGAGGNAVAEELMERLLSPAGGGVRVDERGIERQKDGEQAGERTEEMPVKIQHPDRGHRLEQGREGDGELQRQARDVDGGPRDAEREEEDEKVL